MGSPVTIAERLEEAKRTLERHLQREGLRRTKQREAVLETFIAADAHVSAEEVYDTLKADNPDIGLATVYRCLNLFVQAGIANERRFNEGRLRYEPAIMEEHHDHLICTLCGDIQEFEDEGIERLQEEIARQRNFAVSFHRMELYGVCARCRED
jgi:Fur family ferric uptake transcriptional regulator